MFQCRGMILKRCEFVGHGRVAGIASFGEQAEVSQSQRFYQSGLFDVFTVGYALAEMGVQQHDHYKYDMQYCKTDK